MKMDLEPIKPIYTPAFSGQDQALDPVLRENMRRPIRVGLIIIGVFVVGLGIWAGVSQITSAVVAQGMVRVESNRKLIRHREGGTVRAIPVKEGQLVQAGQPLLILDDVQARAGVDVFQNQYDTALASRARFEAEARGRPNFVVPAELVARMSDPKVASLVRDQQFLFTSRLQFFRGQADVLAQRQQQIDSQIAGVKAQADANDESRRLTQEELNGYQKLFEQGYAPKTLILRYQRSLADLAGRTGALASEMTRLGEQRGETGMQMASARDQRVTQGAEGMRQMETTMADVGPRLTAFKQTLAGTVMRSPVKGYVLDLHQATVGGIVAPGELVMSIVPYDAPLIIAAQIKPDDIDDVKIGMEVKVRLTAFNYRKVSPVVGKVTNVSADLIVDEKSGHGYFRIDIVIPPSELAKLPPGAVLKPGMPAQANIVTGKRSILSYAVSPLTDTIRDSLKEE